MHHKCTTINENKKKKKTALSKCARGLTRTCAETRRSSAAPIPRLCAHMCPLGGDPGVFQTLGRRGSFLWQQLQHGQEERAELGGVLLAPLVLVQQDLQ